MSYYIVKFTLENVSMTTKKKKGVTEETSEYIKKIYELGTKKPKAMINQIEKINRENLEKNLSNESLPVYHSYYSCR